MFVVTLKKAGLKKVGVGVLCCALVVFSAMLGRYISGRSVMAAAAASGNKIESAQDIQTWFTGYGLDGQRLIQHGAQVGGGRAGGGVGGRLGAGV